MGRTRKKSPIASPPTASAWREVELSEIRLHPCAEPYTDVLLSLRHCITDVHAFSVDAVLLLLSIHPIWITPGPSQNYFCLAGHRTLFIANEVLAKGDVPVLVIEKLSSDQQEVMVLGDLYLSPLAHSLHDSHSIRRLTAAFTREFRRRFTPPLKSTRGLAASLGVAVSGLYYEPQRGR